jgi:hypothetical protein
MRLQEDKQGKLIYNQNKINQEKCSAFASVHNKHTTTHSI